MEAFFAYSDRGEKPNRECVTDWTRFKQLVLAQRLWGITVASIVEDVPKGIVSWPELMEESEVLCNAVRRGVGLSSISKEELFRRIQS